MDARAWLHAIHALAAEATRAAPQRFRILNVCGGHERTITEAGLRSVLPSFMELIPGPGCPVCVCPEQDVYAAIQMAMRHNVLLAAFGDMLRVPVNAPKSQPRSLEQAKAAGAAVIAIASPLDAVALARAHPQRTVVFFAAGFETTMAPVAAMLAQGVPDNLLMLLSGRLTWPVVEYLLRPGDAQFDALIAPGHVSAVMGAQEWHFVAEQYHLPTAVAGFTPTGLLAGFHAVLRQWLVQRPALENCYAEAVCDVGNPRAQFLLRQTMRVVDAPWRGIGEIPASGFALAEAYAARDARLRFSETWDDARRHAGEMPPGCQCADVVLGKIQPTACKLYGTVCTPRAPVGPCMVSDEGACRIWWSGGPAHGCSPEHGRSPERGRSMGEIVQIDSMDA